MRLEAATGSRASVLVFLVFGVVLLLPATTAGQSKFAPDIEARSASASAVPSLTRQPLKTYHDGSIWDIGAVGSRDLGCGHGLGSRYSLEDQIHIGRSYARYIEAKSVVLADVEVTDYINRLGQILARNSDAQVPITIKVLDSDEINAFSLPGGIIYVNSGLILAAENEAELAGVVSHEIAHIAACHAAQDMAREELANTRSMPLILRLALRRITLNTVYRMPTTDFESEADLLGIEYLYQAGYDPGALPLFLSKVKIREAQRTGRGGKAFQSHPEAADRIQKTQQEIATLLPPGAEYKLDSSEFQRMKARLSQLKGFADLHDSATKSCGEAGQWNMKEGPTSQD